MLYGKEGTVTLDEVQAALRTKELTKSKNLRTDENGVVTSQSVNALTITRCDTSRKIVWRLMVILHKLSPRVMRMRVLWWCVVWRMKKVMFLTL